MFRRSIDCLIITRLPLWFDVLVRLFNYIYIALLRLSLHRKLMRMTKRLWRISFPVNRQKEEHLQISLWRRSTKRKLRYKVTCLVCLYVCCVICSISLMFLDQWIIYPVCCMSGESYIRLVFCFAITSLAALLDNSALRHYYVIIFFLWVSMVNILYVCCFLFA